MHAAVSGEMCKQVGAQIVEENKVIFHRSTNGTSTMARNGGIM
jgi:hypothetical protein